MKDMGQKGLNQPGEWREQTRCLLRGRYMIRSAFNKKYLRVDNNVKSHQLPEVLALESKLVGIVGTVVKGWVSLGNLCVVAEAVVEHNSCDSRNLGAKIKGVLESWLPVLCFVDATLVGFDKLASRLAGKNTC